MPCYDRVAKARRKFLKELPLNGRKPENNCLIRQKTTKEIMINHKRIRMAKDGED